LGRLGVRAEHADGHTGAATGGVRDGPRVHVRDAQAAAAHHQARREKHDPSVPQHARPHPRRTGASTGMAHRLSRTKRERAHTYMHVYILTFPCRWGDCAAARGVVSDGAVGAGRQGAPRPTTAASPRTPLTVHPRVPALEQRLPAPAALHGPQWLWRHAAGRVRMDQESFWVGQDATDTPAGPHTQLPCRACSNPGVCAADAGGLFTASAAAPVHGRRWGWGGRGQQCRARRRQRGGHAATRRRQARQSTPPAGRRCALRHHVCLCVCVCLRLCGRVVGVTRFRPRPMREK
jgi:hypothetical protein